MVAGGVGDQKPSARWWRGSPDQPAIVRRLLDGVVTECGRTIVKARSTAEGWRLEDGDGSGHGPFDAIVVAVPTVQAMPLLEATPELRDQLSMVRYEPCWSALVTLNREIPIRALGEDIAAPLRAVVRGRALSGVSMRAVLHACPNWSQAHLEEDPGAVAEQLVAAARHTLGLTAEAVADVAVHRWRYARVEREVGVDALFDHQRQVAVIGDGIRGDGVESAFLSGIAGAGYLLRRAANRSVLRSGEIDI